MVQLFRTTLIRTFIIAFWIGIIFLFLFFPQFATRFKKEKSLTIFTFPLLLDADYVSEFEQRTGIKLYIHYYENNDELLAKMRTTRQHGYDIIFPSGFSVEELIKEGRLKKIDKSRLNFLSLMNPKFFGLYFDPYNEYSIPILWEIYGLGYDKEFFRGNPPEASWRLIFDKKLSPKRIGMSNTPREAVAVAARYLFGDIEQLNDEHVEQIKNLLIEQKRWVEVYADVRADDLLESKMCSVVVCHADNIWTRGDFNLGFLVPKEGGFIGVDSFCLPKESNKDELVYQFINYLYEHDVMQHNVTKYALFPVVSNVTPLDEGKKLMEEALNNFDTFHFFKNVLPEKTLTNLWISLKAE